MEVKPAKFPAAPGTNETQALVYALTAVLLWSTVATGFKLGLALLHPAQLLWVAGLFSWSVMLAYALWQRAFRLTPRQALLAFVLSLINPVAYYLTLFAAYERLPAHIAQPLNYTWALTLALLALPILNQPLRRHTVLGLVVSYAGVVMLLTGGHLTPHTGADINGIGVALALFSTVLWALYWLLNTRSRAHPAALLFWSFSGALPVLTLLCWLGPGLPAWSVQHLLYGAWVGLVEMGITFIIWGLALKHTGNAARLGQLIFLSPFLSLLMIHFVLGERIGWHVVAALLIIVAGIRLARVDPTTANT